MLKLSVDRFISSAGNLLAPQLNVQQKLVECVCVLKKRTKLMIILLAESILHLHIYERGSLYDSVPLFRACKYSSRKWLFADVALSRPECRHLVVRANDDNGRPSCSARGMSYTLSRPSTWPRRCWSMSYAESSLQFII